MNFKMKLSTNPLITNVESPDLNTAIFNAIPMLLDEGDKASVRSANGIVYTVTKQEGAEHWNYPGYHFDSYRGDL